MSFDNGNISFRIFHLREGISAETIAKFAARCAPSIETLGASPIQGWVTWRHLFDSDITEEKCYSAPWFHVDLMKAERKVPPKLLKAYCKMAEDEEARARGLEFLPRKLRAEIKKRVTEELQPSMPPTLTSIPMVVNFSANVVYAEAMSEKQLDAFALAFRETTGRQLYLMNAEVAALVLRNVNSNDLTPTLFTDDPTVTPDASCNLGLEFLTWTWYKWEKDGGSFPSRIGEACSYMLEGPLTFYREGKGAYEAVLRHGTPLSSREAGIALQCGKKLRSTKLHIAVGNRVWSCALGADFSIRGLKLPQDEEGGKLSFEERMTATETFVNSFQDLYDHFIKLRINATAWEECVKDMRDWVRRRAGDVDESSE